MRKFLDDNFTKVVCVVIIICTVIASAVFIIKSKESIDDQKQNLYDRAELIEQDNLNVPDEKDIRFIKGENEVKILLFEKDCYIELVYDNDGRLLSKKLTDTRLVGEPVGIFIGILAYGIIFPTAVLTAIWVILMLILSISDQKKEKKKQQQSVLAREKYDL